MGPATEIDGGDLHEPTRPSFSVAVPLASDFDEVPPAQVLDLKLHREPTLKLSPEAEAPTVLRRVVTPVQRAEPRVRMRAHQVHRATPPMPVLDASTKAGIAGLLVGLSILVPITLMVLCSSY